MRSQLLFSAVISSDVQLSVSLWGRIKAFRRNHEPSLAVILFDLEKNVFLVFYIPPPCHILLHRAAVVFCSAARLNALLYNARCGQTDDGNACMALTFQSSGITKQYCWRFRINLLCLQ